MKVFANGDRHEGEYCLDLRQGCGTYHWANGDCYEGDWEVCKHQTDHDDDLDHVDRLLIVNMCCARSVSYKLDSNR